MHRLLHLTPLSLVAASLVVSFRSPSGLTPRRNAHRARASRRSPTEAMVTNRSLRGRTVGSDPIPAEVADVTQPSEHAPERIPRCHERLHGRAGGASARLRRGAQRRRPRPRRPFLLRSRHASRQHRELSRRRAGADRRCRPAATSAQREGWVFVVQQDEVRLYAQPPAGDAEHELACTGWPSAVRLAVSRAATGGSAAPPFPSPGDGADPGWRCDDQWRSHRRPKRLCPATFESTPIGTQACCRHSPPFRAGSTARRSVTRDGPGVRPQSQRQRSRRRTRAHEPHRTPSAPCPNMTGITPAPGAS